MRRLRAERERVRVPDHLGDRERDDVADRVPLFAAAPAAIPERKTVSSAAPKYSDRFFAVSVPVACSNSTLGYFAASFLSKKPYDVAEDHLVALVDEARDGLLELRADRDVLLVRRLHLAAEHLLHVQPPVVVRLRPAAVVVRPDVDPRHLERRRACGFAEPPSDTRAQRSRRDAASSAASASFLPHDSLSPRSSGQGSTIRTSVSAEVQPSADGRLGAPREVDPAVGAPPDVLALDLGLRLLVEDGAADLADLAGAELLDEQERARRCRRRRRRSGRAPPRGRRGPGSGGRIIGISSRSSTPV